MIKLNTMLEKASQIYLGSNIADKFVSILSEYNFDKLFLITEEGLSKLYKDDLFKLISAEYDCQMITLPSGEMTKSFASISWLGEELLSLGVSKNSILISFGGGMVGNIVGLLAGLLFRGIRFVEVPTTMTGQNDSTLSNKQAINGKFGKNLYGIYHAPIFIWSDIKYLKTEPLESRRSGIIEAIKNGFISDPGFLKYLDAKLNPELKFDDQELIELVESIIRSKLVILQKDPTEKEYGIILEYGHTFGHAIEWLLHGEISHGESVSHGMRIAAQLARDLGKIAQAVVDLHYQMIEKRLGYNRPLPKSITAKAIMDTMKFDNKKTGSEMRYVILDKIGSCDNSEGDYLVTIPDGQVIKALDNYLNK